MLAVIYGSGSDQSGRGTNKIFDRASVNVEPESRVENTRKKMFVKNIGARKLLLTNQFVSLLRWSFS